MGVGEQKQGTWKGQMEQHFLARGSWRGQGEGRLWLLWWERGWCLDQAKCGGECSRVLWSLPLGAGACREVELSLCGAPRG